MVGIDLYIGIHFFFVNQHPLILVVNVENNIIVPS